MADYNLYGFQKTCKELGMVANDLTDTTAAANFTKLCAALNASVKVLVDDKYYILPSTASVPITSGKIDIEGGNSLAELAIPANKHSDYFGFAPESGYIKIKNVTITGSPTGDGTSGSFYILNPKDAKTIDLIDITNCKFSNRLRLIHWTFTNGYIDPLFTSFGITRISFTDNLCLNIAVNYHGMFLISNVPVTNAVISRNIIRNFANEFYNNGIENTGDTREKNMASVCKSLIVEENDVRCDVDWITPTTGCGVVLSMYQTFILFEGVSVEYRRNHVEGIHAFSHNNAVYDAFLNGWKVICEDNIWKNNICFAPTSQTILNCLMKSKSYTKTNYIGTSRIYKGNTYLVEKSYADNFPSAGEWVMDYDMLRVELSGYQREIEKVIVDNNIVDVYCLTLNYGQSIYDYRFINNEIHAYKTTPNTSNCLLPFYDLDTSPALGKDAIAKNNIIVIDTVGSAGYDALVVVPGGTVGALLRSGTVTIENNHIVWAGLYALCKCVSSSYATIEKITLRNNYILTTTPGTVSGKALYSCIRIIIRDFVSVNNTIDIPTPGYSSYLLFRGGQQKIELDNKIKSYFRGITRNLCLVADSAAKQELLTKTLYNRFYFRCLHSSRLEDFYFEYIHSPDTTYNKVAFKDSLNNFITQVLNGDTNNNNTVVKLVGTSSKLTVLFKNEVADMGFYLASTIPSDEFVIMEVKCTQVVKG